MIFGVRPNSELTMTSVLSSMLVDVSTRITTRLPPMRRPVRYCRSPSPTKLRMRVPASCGVTLAAARRAVSACSCASSARRRSMAARRAALVSSMDAA